MSELKNHLRYSVGKYENRGHRVRERHFERDKNNHVQVEAAASYINTNWIVLATTLLRCVQYHLSHVDVNIKHLFHFVTVPL